MRGGVTANDGIMTPSLPRHACCYETVTGKSKPDWLAGIPGIPETSTSSFENLLHYVFFHRRDLRIGFCMDRMKPRITESSTNLGM